jgi:integrase
LAYEAELRKRLSLGLPLSSTGACAQEQPKYATFAKYAAHWLETHVRSNYKPSTANDAEIIMRLHLLPAFGDNAVDNISTECVEELKANLLHINRSRKTVNNILTVLRTCLNAAQEAGLVDKPPKIKLLKLPPQKFDFLTFQEAEQLVSTPMPALWKSVILCALRTGMRRGELCGLQWSEVNLEARTITVSKSLVEGVIGAPKNNKVRVIPIEHELYAELADMHSNHGFVFNRNGKPLYGSLMARALDNISSHAGLRHIGWHVFRHTFASHLVMNGVPIRYVQTLMGHSSVQMTERYSHLAPSVLQEAVSVLTSNSGWQPTPKKYGQPAVNAELQAATVANETCTT